MNVIRNTFLKSNFEANLSEQPDGAQTNFKSIQQEDYQPDQFQEQLQEDSINYV